MSALPPGALGAPIQGVDTESLPIVPDLIGLDIGEACTAAAWASTSVDATSVTRAREPWGVVVAQSPSPGTRLKGRWRIHVLVSVPPPSAGEDSA